jgi:hypothetical protein
MMFELDANFHQWSIGSKKAPDLVMDISHMLYFVGNFTLFFHIPWNKFHNIYHQNFTAQCWMRICKDATDNGSMLGGQVL